ncbi:MAG: hypothetical protein HUU31_23815 [Anaerolineae bacterium]|nr:hypothetical protein [Anaerolineae bacterium]
MAKPEDLLVFSKDAGGEARIIPGKQHPYLQDWRAGADLSVLFASGVLESR